MEAATSTTETEEHVSLKLVLNEKGNKVLFAEAGNDFVDVLFSFLTMPLGTIARLVEKESTIGPVSVGCLNTLYKSVADLDQSCFSTDTIKQMLLQPINSAEDYCSTLKLNIDDTPPTKYFLCAQYGNDYDRFDHELTTSTITNKHRCGCGYSFSGPVSSKHFHQGFVNGTATFVITDDLIVMPNCIEYASFGLLQKLGIKDPISVKEMNLNVTKEKVLYLNFYSMFLFILNEKC
ncbi:hypothetical protein QL285_086064 [Trifolium repens]|nr:hypothetical protein QL285_086064 [Trifolium repens]